MTNLLFLFLSKSRDIRSVTGDVDRIQTFSDRAEKYFKKFLSSAPNCMLKSLPYLHLLRNHIGNIMVEHYKLFGWGYGVYCYNAGEHLNKVIRTVELTGTNLS